MNPGLPVSALVFFQLFVGKAGYLCTCPEVAPVSLQDKDGYVWCVAEAVLLKMSAKPTGPSVECVVGR